VSVREEGKVEGEVEGAGDVKEGVADEGEGFWSVLVYLRAWSSPGDMAGGYFGLAA
jgi:hypothetical protein